MGKLKIAQQVGICLQNSIFLIIIFCEKNLALVFKILTRHGNTHMEDLNLTSLRAVSCNLPLQSVRVSATILILTSNACKILGSPPKLRGDSNNNLAWKTCDSPAN